ncbi:MAG: glycosyltransferase family 39 protein [Patescibacteria group bacterium]|nr:glycosyltransferase family 39 protein [Patescibacteria group bacterium]
MLIIKNILSKIKKNNILEKLGIIIILFIAVFLRFYRFEEFITFLGDQGRDAIIIKRILTAEHFPAIGAPTSIGQVYLGPFYYYFIAPWLLIFRFNPVGPAFGVGFFSCLYVLINYLIIKELINKKTAFLSSLFIAFSFVMIDLSRFSWNPNLLPFFTLLSVYFFIKSLKTNKWYFFSLSGAFLSFSLQLHYVFLFSLPAIFLIYLINFVKNLKNFKKTIINYSLLIINFFVFSSPLLIFDLRHNFLNSKNFIALFSQSGSTFQAKTNNFFDSFYFLNFYSFNLSINKIFIYGLIISLFISAIFLIRKKTDNIRYFLLIFIFSLFFMSFFSGPRHPHYFGSLYPLYFVIIAYFLSYSFDSIFGKLTLILFIIGFIFLNFQKYPYFKFKGNNQISHSKKVALFLKDKIGKKSFNIATWPVDFTEDNYLYFLELENKKPANRQKIEITNQMFVLCAKEPCQIINSPSWNISMFGESKIDKIWNYEGLKIYKLVHK